MNQTLLTWGGYIGMMVTLVGYFLFPLRRKEIDKATKTLIETLKSSVEALQESDRIKDGKIDELKTQQIENIAEIKKAREEIQVIRDDRDRVISILEARDKNTADFQTQVLLSVKITNEVHTMLKEYLTKKNA